MALFQHGSSNDPFGPNFNPVCQSAPEDDDPMDEDAHPLVRPILQNADVYVAAVVSLGILTFMTFLAEGPALIVALSPRADVATIVVPVVATTVICLFHLAGAGRRSHIVPLFFVNTIVSFAIAGYYAFLAINPNEPNSRIGNITISDNTFLPATAALDVLVELGLFLKMMHWMRKAKKLRAKRRVTLNHADHAARNASTTPGTHHHPDEVHVRFYDPIPGNQPHEVVLKTENEELK